MKLWKRRYFYLKENLLYYYRDHAEAVPTGVMYLNGCFVEKLTFENRFGILVQN